MTKQVNGSSVSAETFDDLLAEQGILQDAEEATLKRVLAWQIAKAMKENGISKTAMAARMNTDRRQLDRLLDPTNHSLTLSTLQRAASMVGRQMRIELV